MAPSVHHVVHVAREYGDILGVGGARDTTKGICTAAADQGLETHVFLPAPSDMARVARYEPFGSALSMSVPMNLSKRCRRSEQAFVSHYRDPHRPNLVLHLVEADRFRLLPDGAGTTPRESLYTYTEYEAGQISRPDLAGKRYHDFFEMNTLLVKATLLSIAHLDLRPDLVHCHDSHMGMLPMIAQHASYAHPVGIRNLPTLTTIFNLADRYRAEITYDEFVPTVCSVSEWVMRACVYNGQFDPVLAAGLFGTMLSTLSENYAREARETSADLQNNWLGHRLAGLNVPLIGITSGVDPHEADPSRPELMGLPAAFAPQVGDLSGKAVCKRDLLHELSLTSPSDDPLLLIFLGRLVHQKGFDILAEAVTELLAADQGLLLAGIGDGSKEVARLLKALEGQFPGQVAVRTTFERSLANRILAGGDICVIPSRFEPCGLVDLTAQLYGTLPVVHQVGGLVKVKDGKTGFSYLGEAKELCQKLHEVITLYRSDRERIRVMQMQAAQTVLKRYTWGHVFTEGYLPLYKQVVSRAQSIT
jgi:starch synthase